MKLLEAYLVLMVVRIMVSPRLVPFFPQLIIPSPFLPTIAIRGISIVRWSITVSIMILFIPNSIVFIIFILFTNFVTVFFRLGWRILEVVRVLAAAVIVRIPFPFLLDLLSLQREGGWM
jgi:hypothetical protein